MAAYAALVSLMNNIEQIQRHTRLPIHFNQKQSEFLLEKVNFLVDFLEKYNYRGAGEEIKVLESQMRHAAYTAEDIIETHVVDTVHAYSGSVEKANDLMIEKMNPTLSCLDKVMEAMEVIKEEAMKLKDKEIEYLQPIIPITDPLIAAGKITTVGFDDELKRITERLSGQEHSRQVIPIVGMGGIGKTTLAKAAYEKLKGGKHFDFCAWVTISQHYDLKNILLGLLPDESSHKSDKELGEKLYKSVYKRRYLIVLDDMWSVEAWEMVQLFLPDNNISSRIIVTTRESSVSTCFGSINLKMNFLDEDKSWKLFCEKVFAPKSCPNELEEVGRKIVSNCKVLPLSIVVIGGLLAKSDRRKEYWEYIAANTKEIITSENTEQCMKILSLSYQNLPVQLKPCFLYLGAFPEDEKIHASNLIKLWVAEGFLKSNSSKELEVLGREFLNDLVSRNLIMVVEQGLNGKIEYCMIHDLLRDSCLKLVKNEKFMYASNTCIHDEMQFIGSHRRISFYKSSSPQVLSTYKSGSMSLTRTLIGDLGEVLPLENFRLLRVLNCTDARIYFELDTLMLVNSRLIAVGTPRTTIIPSTICLSWNLQILIVSPGSGIAFAPLEIWEMTQLRHLESRGRLYLPDPPPSQQMNTQECDVTMKNLHTLSTIKDFRLSDEVIKRIPNIKKLGMYYELTGKELEERGLKYLGLLENLKSLDLAFNKPPGTELLSYLSFPNSLKNLTLNGCGLHWEDMSMIASIPQLEVLKLWLDAFKGPKWELDEEVFRCLKYLEIFAFTDLVHWMAEDTHFPCLEHLKLEWLEELVEIPSGIGEIPTLQNIELFKCSESAVTSAKKLQKEQEELGNMDLKVEVLVLAWEPNLTGDRCL